MVKKVLSLEASLNKKAKGNMLEVLIPGIPICGDKWVLLEQ